MTRTSDQADNALPGRMLCSCVAKPRWQPEFKASRCRYEALQLGSVPVYVWDYDIIVPYQELLNWNEVSPKSLPCMPPIVGVPPAEGIQTTAFLHYCWPAHAHPLWQAAKPASIS